MFGRAMLLLVLCTLTIVARVAVAVSPLQRAVIANDLLALRHVLATAELDINCQDGLGRTALHYAARLAYREAVAILLAHNAETKLQDNDGKLPFHLAVDNAADTAEHAAVAAILLENMAGVEGRDEQGWQPLLWAVLSQDLELVQRLIDGGASIWTWRAQSAVDVALLMEDQEMLIGLIDASGGLDAHNKKLQQLLVDTAARGDLQALQMLLEIGVNVNSAIYSGRTALMSAALLANQQIVRVLLERGANLDVVDRDIKTALTYAIEQGHLEIVRMMLENRANRDGNWLPLQHAVLDGDQELVQQLIETGASVWEGEKQSAVDIALALADQETLALLVAADSNGKVADEYWVASLAKARRSNSLEHLMILLENSININNADYYGFTALMVAVVLGDLEIMKMLLERGADVNLIGTYGDTALLLALCGAGVLYGTYARHGNGLQAAELLIKYGADINVISRGETLLMRAVKEGDNARIVAMLLQHGADISATNKQGQTLLTLAINYNRPAVANILFEQMDKNSVVAAPEALVFFAANGNLEAVQVLLARDIDIETRNKSGFSALMTAVVLGHTEIVEFLLERQAQVDARDSMEKTALMHAAAAGALEIVNRLIAYGADVNAVSNGGVTVFMEAALAMHVEVMELLLQQGAEFTNKHRELLYLLVKSTHRNSAEQLQRVEKAIRKAQSGD